MIVFDCSRLYPFEYNGLQPHTSFLLIFSHILRVEGNTVVYLTVTFDLLVKQIKERQGITEVLKASNQLERIRRMNNTRNAADEIVIHELIYT